MSTDRFPWTDADQSDYRWRYWDAWTGDPKWVKQARIHAEARVASRHLREIVEAPIARLLSRIDLWLSNRSKH